MQADLIKEIVASIFRKLLVLLFALLIAPLVTHGWLSSDLGKRVESGIDNWAVMLAVAAIGFAWPVIWGAWQKVVARARTILALHTPVSEPVEVVDAKVAQLSHSQKLRLGTSPGDVPIPKSFLKKEE